jgi:NAD(P)H-flavin reductase
MLATDSPPDPFLPDDYRVTRIHRELDGVVTLELAHAHGKRPSFRPGQFNMLYAFGIGEIAISISAATAGGQSFVHTVRDVGAVSSAIARLEAGANLGLRGPFGTAWPVEDAQRQDLVFVAGGLGLAPLRPALHAVLAAREHYGRVAVLIGARTPGDILYRDEIEDWRRLPDIDIDVTVDHADATWQGHVGVVPQLISKADFDPANTTAFVCGPEVMMRFTAHALHEAGLPSERVWLSMERNMKCAVGLCGRCQFGPSFICKDGPVMRLDRIEHLLLMREI